MDGRTRIVTGGGGVGALAGLLPLLVGSTFVALGVLIARGSLEPGSPPDPGGLIFTAFGIPAVALGLGLLLGRSGVTLDRARRVVVRWRGLLGLPLWRTAREVPDDALVTLERVVRRQGKSTVVLFPVEVVPSAVGSPGEDLGGAPPAVDPGAGPRGARPSILLGEPREHLEGRRLAERAGKAFGLDVEDRTVTPPSRRRADQLDASLRQQHRGAPPPAPRSPADPRCTLRRGRGQATIELPPADPALMVVARVATGCLGLALLAPLGFAFMALHGAASIVLAASSVALCVAIGRSVLGAARRATNPTRIEVGTDAVSVITIDGRESLPLDELEEVAIASAGPRLGLGGLVSEQLLLLSDERRLAVGLKLAPDERDWVRDVVRWVAATGEAPPERDAPAAS